MPSPTSTKMEVPSGKAIFLGLQHVGQIVLSVYGLRHSFVAITNLQKYEATSKKLANWSKQAQDQLNKTRTTQAAGAIAVRTFAHSMHTHRLTIGQTLLSLVAAVVLLIPLNAVPSWSKPTASSTMVLITISARYYIKDFWAPGEKDSTGKDKGTKVPLPNMEGYNLAVQKTEDLLKCLEYLEYSWVISAVLDWTIGRMS